MPVNIEPGPVASFKTYRGVHATLPGRIGAQSEVFPINFEYAGGGLGDYICWTPALQWIACECPWVHGRVWAPAYFIQFAKHFFGGIPNWEVNLIEKYSEAEMGTLCRGLQSAPNQLINATGANLLRQGFYNFVNTDDVPEDTVYPELNLESVKLHKKLRGLEKRYVVFTPGGTTQSRFVPAKYWNPLVDWCVSEGLTPVFLGKTQLADVHRSYFDDEIYYDKGIDLREKTSLIEAARIMEDALCVIGLDNGLLHLAACTSANIVFAYNIASPKDRRPKRNKGGLVDLVLSKEDLGCIHCQSKLKLLYTHNFKNCIYRDTKCIDMLFANSGERWKKAIASFY